MKRVVMTGVLALGVLLGSAAVFGEGYSTVRVNADILNVRASNSIEAEVLGQVQSGQSLVVLQDLGEWYVIQTPFGKNGYVSKEFCSSASAYADGYITKTNVNMRNVPTTEGSQVVAQYQLGQTLQIVGEQNGWYQVKVGEQTGYIRNDMLAMGTPTEVAVNRGADVKQEQLVAFAKAQVGKPYKWGQAGPNAFDCSGFVSYVYKNVYGIDLGHSSSGMSQMGAAVNKGQLQVGDLVFFATGGSSRINHVGIYLGGGEFIHASSSGTNGKNVTISPINSGYYAGVFQRARRVN